ncbi:MAG: IS1096 element passenger TnpR family protein [Flavobacteriaceae bacterium]
MIYHFRLILDTKEDVFRDIALEENATFEDFHNAITQAFGFGGSEMAVFYESDDEWQQGDSISLFDMGEDDARRMSDTLLQDVFPEVSKMLYVYDFLNLWTFFVELIETDEPKPGNSYPLLLFSHGEVPEEAPEKTFEAEKDSWSENDFDENGLDDFEEPSDDWY